MAPGRGSAKIKEEALLRLDVAVHGKEDMLRKVFVEKQIFCGEHF